MRSFDFSSWQSVLTTLIGIAIFALVGIGIRILFMVTLQQRRERMNRQINERLKVLIAAYKVLGGSFTGDLAVDPRHLRDLPPEADGSDRARRIRDAVEGALSDSCCWAPRNRCSLPPPPRGTWRRGVRFRRSRWSPRCARSSAARWT